MIIKTESGATYTIQDGLARKTRDGILEDAFKCSYMKPLMDYVEGERITLDDLRLLPEGDPVIGKRLYIGGWNNWWVTTKIVSVEND